MDTQLLGKIMPPIMGGKRKRIKVQIPYGFMKDHIKQCQVVVDGKAVERPQDVEIEVLGLGSVTGTWFLYRDEPYTNPNSQVCLREYE